MNRRVDWLITQMKVIGGAEIYTRQIIPLLQESGWQTRVIVLTEGGRLLTELKKEGINTLELGLKTRDLVKGFNLLSQVWLDDPPEILHTHLYHAGILGRFVARNKRIHRIIVHQHGLERNRRLWRTFVDRFSSRLVTQYVATCQAVATKLQSRERISPEKIKIIYNGVDIDQIERTILESFPGKVTVTGMSIPREPNSCWIGSVGRLSTEKGQDILFEAIDLLNQNALKVDVFLFGSGPMQEKLAEKAKNLKIEKQVHFFGFVDPVNRYLKEMDIFVQASRWEGLSLALLNGMAIGLPVIATDTGGTSEVIQNNLSGILVKPEKPEQIAQKIALLMCDRNLRQTLGSAAKARIKDQFTIQHTLNQLINLYETRES
jgi:glycosyltransferase involved in cell wall biosynthesis